MFYGVGGERLAEFTLTMPTTTPSGWYLRFTEKKTLVWFGSKLLRDGKYNVIQDRLGSVRWRYDTIAGTSSTADYYPYGQEKPSATADDREKFATYLRDAESGLDYADQRYHNPGWGRYLTADPLMPDKYEDPNAWNLYTYVQGDPINYYDPDGLDVKDIPLNEVPGIRTCWNKFYDEFLDGYRGKGDNRHNEWLDSDVGTMALQVFFEFETTDTQANRVIWRGMAHTIRNRWLLENSEKKAAGFTTKGFKELVYQVSGPPRKGEKPIWEKKQLEKGRRDRLTQYMNGDENSAMCKGIIASFSETRAVYYNYGNSNVGDALFYASGSSTPGINKDAYQLLTPQIVYGTNSSGQVVTWRFWELGRKSTQ
ncbi:MAG: RHS repeat-associated core domain-containing protein [Acidobacteriota bacterium]